MNHTPRSEPTPLGEQFLIVDVPRRAIPTGPLRAAARQRDLADLPLFGASTSDTQLSIEEGGVA